MPSLQIPAEEFNDFMETEDPDYDWIIPGILEHGDRVIITGGEGKGKSTLLRQIEVGVAAGINPFTLEEMEAAKVLAVDLENPERTIRREMRRHFGDKEVPRGNLSIVSMPGGMNLSESSFAEALTDTIERVEPALVVIGPMYKMTSQPLDKEEHSKQLSSVIDFWIKVFHFAVIIESHQPHATVVQDPDPRRRMHRPERPVGSSLWMRWPEFGFCLEDGGVLRPWRGMRDADRQWPEKLLRGDDWPWVALGQALCLKCGNPLTGNQERYCSERCSGAARQAKFRAGR